MTSWKQEIIERYTAEIADMHKREIDHLGELPHGVGTPEEEAAKRFEEVTQKWETRIPPRMSWATPDDLQGSAREAFEEWRACRGQRNVLILGPVGTGKSVAGFAMLRHAEAFGVWRSQWTSTVKLMERLRPSADDPVTIDRWAKTDVLLLDDMGGEKPSDWVAERLFILMDERWQWKRPTIVTSNLTPTQLRETLGDRTYSRLQDDAIAVTLTGSDRRRAA